MGGHDGIATDWAKLVRHLTSAGHACVIFDLDGTLADSKAPIDAEMIALLGALLRITRVAIISGGDWTQFEARVLSRLPSGDYLRNMSLLPTCGTKFYRYGSAWERLYSEDLTSSRASRSRRSPARWFR